MRSTCALLMLLAASPAQAQRPDLPLAPPAGLTQRAQDLSPPAHEPQPQAYVQTQGPARLHLVTAAQPFSLADVVHVTVLVALAEGEKVEPPRQLDAAAPWTVVERSPPIVARAHDNSRTWQQSYKLAPLMPGKLVLQMPSFRLVRADRSESIDWAPIEFTVAAPLIEPDPSLARWTPQFELPPEVPPRGRSAVGLWLLVLAALAGLAAWLTLGRGRRPSLVRRSADAWATARLQRLQAHLQSPRFADLLTLVLRRYLQRTALPNARRQNTSELLDAVQACAGLDAPQKAALTRIFRQCDAARYAAVGLDQEEAGQLLADATAFVAAQRRG